MKIKDLPDNVSLAGVRFKYPPDGKFYYWFSQWQGKSKAGVFGKKSLSDSQVYPLFVEDLNECLEWEVVPPKAKKIRGVP